MAMVFAPKILGLVATYPDGVNVIHRSRCRPYFESIPRSWEAVSDDSQNPAEAKLCFSQTCDRIAEVSGRPPTFAISEGKKKAQTGPFLHLSGALHHLHMSFVTTPLDPGFRVYLYIKPL